MGYNVGSGKEKQEKLRLCRDYRSTVNQCVKNSVYRLPTITEAFGTQRNSEVLTKLDLAQTYRQFGVDDTLGGRYFRKAIFPRGIWPSYYRNPKSEP